MTATIEDIQALTKKKQDEIAALRQKYLQEAKAVLGDLSQSLFEKYPELRYFGWTQYTGYFCDGDPCYFNVHSNADSIVVEAGDLASQSDWGDYGENPDAPSYYDTYTWDDTRRKTNATPGYERAYELYTDIETFLKAFDEDVYKDMFGDHVKVTVRREGIEVNEYDHE